MKDKSLDIVPGVDWKQAPYWANYWAMDRDGEAFWFEEEPVQNHHEWVWIDGAVRIAPDFGWSAMHWQQSLVGGPKPYRFPEDFPLGKPNAEDYLNMAAAEMADRAASRDAEDGERSMLRAVKAFNELYGTELTETQGWQFMSILKKSRGAQGEYREDDYVDDIAYCALAAESAAKNG